MSKQIVNDMIETLLKLIVVGVILTFLYTREIQANELPHIAILEIENTNALQQEIVLVEHMLRSSFVNSGKYTVLERENMDKILHERYINEYGVLSDREAAKLGKILQVEEIVIPTVMKINSEFFLEIRMVDVATSSIRFSKTGTCRSIERLSKLTLSIVEKICGVSISTGMIEPDSSEVDEFVNDEQINELDYYTFDSPKKTASEIKLEKRNMKLFRMVGISSYDYKRFSDSYLPMNEWAKKDNRNIYM